MKPRQQRGDEKRGEEVKRKKKKKKRNEVFASRRWAHAWRPSESHCSTKRIQNSQTDCKRAAAAAAAAAGDADAAGGGAAATAASPPFSLLDMRGVTAAVEAQRKEGLNAFVEKLPLATLLPPPPLSPDECIEFPTATTSTGCTKVVREASVLPLPARRRKVQVIVTFGRR